ncbi:MAG TPA: hypothetical protein DEA46_02295 [Candidatus Moranbacteria bacterium]|nr:hypothetical protein [Candidatus Moranbacteria bacterium]
MAFGRLPLTEAHPAGRTPLFLDGHPRVIRLDLMAWDIFCGRAEAVSQFGKLLLIAVHQIGQSRLLHFQDIRQYFFINHRCKYE